MLSSHSVLLGHWRQWTSLMASEVPINASRRICFLRARALSLSLHCFVSRGQDLLNISGCPQMPSLLTSGSECWYCMIFLLLYVVAYTASVWWPEIAVKCPSHLLFGCRMKQGFFLNLALTTSVSR